MTRLELSDNRLTGHDIQFLVDTYTKEQQEITLGHLKLSNNLIRDFENLLPLAAFRADVNTPQVLLNLDLGGNPVTDVERYRERIFEGLLPELEVLDGLDPEGNEVNSENDQEAEEYDIGDRADGGDVISDDDEDDEGDDDEEDDAGMYSDEEDQEEASDDSE